MKTLVWHGCLGFSQDDKCSEGTSKVAGSVIRSAAVATVIGDEMADAVSSLVLTPFFAHVSSGGDVGMKLLLGRELPGFAALSGGI